MILAAMRRAAGSSPKLRKIPSSCSALALFTMSAALVAPSGFIRMSSAPSRMKLKPREAVSSCHEETPRSRKPPSIGPMSSLFNVCSNSEKFACTARKRPCVSPIRSVANASASGSWSSPITRAPACRNASLCPPPPSVPSTMSRPGAGTMNSTASRSNTDSW